MVSNYFRTTPQNNTKGVNSLHVKTKVNYSQYGAKLLVLDPTPQKFNISASDTKGS